MRRDMCRVYVVLFLYDIICYFAHIYHNTYEEMKCTVPVEHVAEKKLIREIHPVQISLLTDIRKGSKLPAPYRIVLYRRSVDCMYIPPSARRIKFELEVHIILDIRQ